MSYHKCLSPIDQQEYDKLAERIAELERQLEEVMLRGEAATIGRLRSERDEAREAIRDLVLRVNKYIERRVADEGPDWEFTKLDREMEKAMDAARGGEGE